jgi:hypothetical protein
MAMQASEFLKEYTVYAAPLSGLLDLEPAVTDCDQPTEALGTPDALPKLSGV